MYRAICRYQSDNPDTLSFEKNDRFTISADDNNDKEWRLVDNDKCFTGYVPISYLKKDETPNGEAILILERGIDYLKEQAAEGIRNGTGDEGGLSVEDRRGLLKLEEHLEALVLNKRTSVRRPAVKVHNNKEESTYVEPVIRNDPIKPTNSNPAKDQRPQHRQTKSNAAACSPSPPPRHPRSTSTGTPPCPAIQHPRHASTTSETAVTPEGYVSMSQTFRGHVDPRRTRELEVASAAAVDTSSSPPLAPPPPSPAGLPVHHGQQRRPQQHQQAPPPPPMQQQDEARDSGVNPGFKVYAQRDSADAAPRRKSTSQGHSSTPPPPTREKPNIPMRQNSKPNMEPGRSLPPIPVEYSESHITIATNTPSSLDTATPASNQSHYENPHLVSAAPTIEPVPAHTAPFASSTAATPSTTTTTTASSTAAANSSSTTASLDPAPPTSALHHFSSATTTTTTAAGTLPRGSHSQSSSSSLHLRSMYTGVAADMIDEVYRALTGGDGSTTSTTGGAGGTLVGKRQATSAVEAVLKVLSKSAGNEVNRVCTKILADVNEISAANNEDVQKLTSLLVKLTRCKDDAQQRSWHLHDDEGTINEMLTQTMNLLSIPENKDEFITLLKEDDYMYVDSLVLYFQMESRVKLRLLLLKIFGVINGYDVSFISRLMNSVLPLELAQVIACPQTGIQMICFSCLVLTMLFSSGESLPNSHLTVLDEQFAASLLHHIEWQADRNERVSEVAVGALLAFGLSFPSALQSPAVKAVRNNPSKHFLARLLHLLNREADPVCLFPEHLPRPQNSITKFTSDLYESSPPAPTGTTQSTTRGHGQVVDGAGVFYVNDERVLIDIVIRQLNDLSPGDEMRTEHLSLMLMIVRHSDYCHHRYRADDLLSSLVAISNDLQVAGATDQNCEFTKFDVELAEMIQSELR